MSTSILSPKQIITNGNMALASITSTIIPITYQDNVGIEITWTGSPTGVIEVDASVGGTTYYALTFDPVLAQPAGSASGYLINLNQFPFAYFKVVYTRTSGSGTLNAYAMTRGI